MMVNPRARRGDGSVASATGILRHAGIEAIEAKPGPDETLSDLIRQNANKIDLVVIGGGDGSLNAAAQGLVDTKLPFGVLPMGTANDFARTMGMQPDIDAAARIIAAGKTQKIDLGEANGHYFFNVASIGFSAELAKELTEDAKKKWGVLGYGLVSARLLAGSRLFTATLEHDGTVEKFRTMQIAVGNGRHYGGGMTVHESATADDGKLDFYSLEIDHWWRLLALLPSLRKGTQGKWDDVRAFATKELTLRTSRPRDVNLDGDLKTQTPVTFKVHEKVLDVFVA
ncbi:lipid kinase [Limoniibacter endophyticus]|uniref:Lipid kinase n=2 Tax=Limoniibacter endophyticus TaxID=1565040 RepID=A0A8J3GFC5_9HYPH|nr:lipid kinase [Limoniibacter endophyticus]